MQLHHYHYFLNRKIDMGVPNIKIIRLEEILDDDLNNEVIGDADKGGRAQDIYYMPLISMLLKK